MSAIALDVGRPATLFDDLLLLLDTYAVVVVRFFVGEGVRMSMSISSTSLPFSLRFRFLLLGVPAWTVLPDFGGVGKVHKVPLGFFVGVVAVRGCTVPLLERFFGVEVFLGFIRAEGGTVGAARVRELYRVSI